MKLTVLNSGSSANGYILQNDNEAIVIECGSAIMNCLKALNFNTSKVKACLVSHEHGDHSRYIEQYMEYTPVYCTEGTASAIKYKGDRRPKIVKFLKRFTAGNFTITPFETQHDCAEPSGFLIEHPDIGRLLFATDTYYLEYTFEGLTQIMIECNYSRDILDRNVANGVVHKKVRDRVIASHMDLETTIKALQANNLQKVNNIILLHLSGNNSDAIRFKREVENATGKMVTIARTGVELSINKTP